MEKIFNTLIDSFIDNSLGLAEHFLNEQLASNLRNNLISLYAHQEFQNAGTGNVEKLSFDKLVRSDKIYWLDRKHNNRFENQFFDLMDDFVLHLNRTCYTGITGYEFHYALYEIGAFYSKHLDQFKNNDSRKYSVIMYLNTNWLETDGGALTVYFDGNQYDILPENGKIVFFNSSKLLHEVQVSNRQRLSITGWLKVDAL